MVLKLSVLSVSDVIVNQKGSIGDRKLQFSVASKKLLSELENVAHTLRTLA